MCHQAQLMAVGHCAECAVGLRRQVTFSEPDGAAQRQPSCPLGQLEDCGQSQLIGCVSAAYGVRSEAPSLTLPRKQGREPDFPLRQTFGLRQGYPCDEARPPP